MGCLLCPKTCRRISQAKFWGLRSLSSPVLRHLIHSRYLEEGELQKEQQQVLGSKEIHPPAKEGAVNPNTEAQVGDSSQQGLGTLGQQQLAEVRLPTQSLLLVNRSCVLLFLAQSIPAGRQYQIFSAKGKHLGVSAGRCWQTRAVDVITASLCPF